MHKIKKALYIIIASIIAIAVVVVIFISPVTKYLVQKYDEKYLGRQITMNRAYVNLFTGYIHFSNLKMYEYKNDSVFISIAGLSGNINLIKLFSKAIKVNNLTIDEPLVRIIQRKNDFNFDDFGKQFSSKGHAAKTKKKPFHFYFLNVKINEGHFYYIDEVIPVNFSIKDVYIESEDGWRWDRDTISAQVSFLSEIGTGGMKGDFGMNLKSLFYSLDVVVNTFDLNVLEQYLKKIANYGSFRANFDADIKANGCFREAENINIQGDLAINDFHFGKDTIEDYAAFDTLVLSMDDVNPKEQKYFIDSVLLIHPYFMYERFDHGLDNIQTMFGKAGGNVSAAISDEAQFNLIFAIGKYIKKLAKNFFRSDFNINHLAINDADLKFNDYSLSEKFTLELNPLIIVADSIDKNLNRVNITLESEIEPYGNLSVFLSINPKDTGDFDLQYHFQNIPASMFNPYTISYTSFPLDRGTIELSGDWKVRNSIIQSNNHLVIIDPRVTERLKNKDNKWLPMPLIMSFIRESGNVIDYEIPITGTFKDPKFRLTDVFFDLLTNIFVKPPTIPYQLTVKNVETEIEKSLMLKWNMRQGSLLPTQEKFIKKMASFLKKNHDASITVYPMQYDIKEKEYILFYEAKKIFYLSTNNLNAQSFNKEDSIKVDKMSIRDSVFVHYLDSHVNDSMMFTIQEQCAALIDPAIINAEFARLTKERETAFILYFNAREVAERVEVSSSENVIPYGGFSYYKIEYHGDFPNSLIKAYQKIDELNDEARRKKYSQVRETTGGEE